MRLLLGTRVRFREPMGRHTSLQIGGPADAYARAESLDELRELLALCQRFELPWRVLGNGFNTLVLDGGLRGVTLSLALWRELHCDAERVVAEAGVTHTALARFCTDQGRTGLEFTVGIPGTVGGWIRMNAGTRETDVSRVLHGVHLLDAASGSCAWQAAAQLVFRYRELELAPDTIILGGSFTTRADEPARIRERIEAQLTRRRDTQPIHARSCGSVFRNPEGSAAGQLIDAAGMKGARVGDAEISPIHANFITNHGRATAQDVLCLIERAQEAVARKFGVALETEVHVVGEPA